MRYLLDTKFVSALIRDPRGLIAEQIKSVGEDRVCTSVIVAAEIRYGATKKASRRLTDQVEAVLRAIDTLPFDSPADKAYGVIRVQLEQAGTPIGGNDLLIAAHAAALGFTLVTDNDGEFSRINGLRVEHWLRAKPKNK